ncbi:MASE1 domain-containing protein [Streptomyces sp. NPDC014986]|uniref:MASE1 domain-containing protein n=1 Tax=Streptomyces sp. NPDC014986 TaxID=3364934 RepID=UPI0036F6599D
MLISSSAGAGLLLATGDPAAENVREVWVGDAMGVLLVTPLLLVIRRVRAPVRWSRWPEALGLTVISGCLVPLATHNPASPLFVVYPLLVRAALRFQLGGSMTCALSASVVATAAAPTASGRSKGCPRCRS